MKESLLLTESYFRAVNDRNMPTMTSAKLQTPQIVTNASCVIIIAVDHS